MEVYFEVMRFVSILLDFSKNKMYTWGFNKGHARSWFLVLMNNALPEVITYLQILYHEKWNMVKGAYVY